VSDFGQVGQFHHKFGLPNTTYGESPGPREVPADLLQFRIKFIFEELQELLEGMGWKFPQGFDLYTTTSVCAITDPSAVDEAKQFDALIDLVYVIYGLGHIKGYPWHDGWNMVQHANMQKERATRADQSERGGTWDIVKPEGWKPPDIQRLLESFGWKFPHERINCNEPQSEGVCYVDHSHSF
jgi:predicted HAD superfamily Cof-like phosphohydrolase